MSTRVQGTLVVKGGREEVLSRVEETLGGVFVLPKDSQPEWTMIFFVRLSCVGFLGSVERSYLHPSPPGHPEGLKVGCGMGGWVDGWAEEWMDGWVRKN